MYQYMIGKRAGTNLCQLVLCKYQKMHEIETTFPFEIMKRRFKSFSSKII